MGQPVSIPFNFGANDITRLAMAIRDDGQQPFDFILPVLEDVKKVDFKTSLADIVRKDREAAQEESEYWEKEGYRLFHARTVNDDISVEADYGAPAQGLTFFKKLIDPTRSFRYTRIREIEGSLRTHHEQLQRVGEFLNAKGFQIFDKLKPGQFPSQMHFCNGGVTRAFTGMAKYLTEQDRRYSWAREAMDMPKYKAAFLVPVPTYGLFYFELKDILAKTGVELVTIARNDDGSVNQVSLANTLAHFQLTNTRAIGYYDCNPHNPSGHIRTREETIETAEKLMAQTKRYYAEDEPHLAGLEKKIGSDEWKKIIWSHLEKPQHGIVIIDDMAYEGLEHIDKTPFSFGQVSPEVANQTVVLKGISKLGLPGARVGLMLGHSELIEPLYEPQLYTEFAASTLGVDILTARYSDGPHRALFDRHQQNLRRIHRRNAGMIEAFIYGLDATKKLNPTQKNRLVRTYAQSAGLDLAQARAHLKAGLPAFHLQHDVECGFFVNFDMSSLQGHLIHVRYDKRLWSYMMPINSSNSLWTVFKSFDIDVVPAASQGGKYFSLSARVTLSLEEKELLRLYQNLRRMHDYFFGEKPQIQLDLFRKNPALKAA